MPSQRSARDGAPPPGPPAAPGARSAPWVLLSLAALAGVEGVVTHFGIFDLRVPGFIFGELAALLLIGFFLARRSPVVALACVAVYVAGAVAVRLTGAVPVPSVQGIVLRALAIAGFAYVAVRSMRAPPPAPADGEH